MDPPSLDNELGTKEDDSKVVGAGKTEFQDLERRRMESIGDETEGEEAQNTMSERSGYLHIPYGFQSRGSYKHASKNCEIVGGIIIFTYLFRYNYYFGCSAVILLSHYTETCLRARDNAK